MTKQEKFINELAPLVQKYAPLNRIAVCSPIIAQGCLESDYGTHEPKVKYHNYFGIKYNPKQPNRCPSGCGFFADGGSEQNADGTYTSSSMLWWKFDSLESCVKGYFEFISISNYENLKGVDNPYQYLVNIKEDHYATSLDYVKNVYRVIESNNLTRFDSKVEEKKMYTMKVNVANRDNYGVSRNVSNIKYIVIHYTANDGDTDENNGKYFRDHVVKASAHYFVDSDSITQSVPDNYVAYSVGGNKYSTNGGSLYGVASNSNTLSIELCDDFKNGTIYPSAQTIANAVDFVRTLMEKYSIPVERVIRHYDVNGKPCPLYWCNSTDKDKLWLTEFRNKLGTVSVSSGTATIITPPASTATEYKVEELSGSLKIIYTGADGVNVRTEPNLKSSVSQIVHSGIYTVVGITSDKAFYKLKSGSFITSNAKYVQFTKSSGNSSNNTTTAPQNTTSFIVQVTATTLNVRSGAGTTYPKTTEVKKNSKYTIVDTNGNWGKLKSGAGWICLDYTKRV